MHFTKENKPEPMSKFRMVHKLFQNIEEEGIFSNLFFEASVLSHTKSRQIHYKERKI